MSGKHTPGPWVAQLPADEYSARIRVVDERALNFANHRIADLQYWTTSPDRGPSRDEAFANARLIASSPDLLEELDACLGTLLQCFPDASIDSVIGKNIISARAAIQKATGETP